MSWRNEPVGVSHQLTGHRDMAASRDERRVMNILTPGS
jgi:hypothetical protein